MFDLKHSSAWIRLDEHYAQIKDVHMRDLFEQDNRRFDKFSLTINDIIYDYSKNRINDETLQLLLNLANDMNVPQWIEKLFKGEKITRIVQTSHDCHRERAAIAISTDRVWPTTSA